MVLQTEESVFNGLTSRRAAGAGEFMFDEEGEDHVW